MPTVEALIEICRIVAAVCEVRALPPAKLRKIVAALRGNDAGMLANCILGERGMSPSAAELERLTDE